MHAVFARALTGGAAQSLDRFGPGRGERGDCLARTRGHSFGADQNVKQGVAETGFGSATTCAVIVTAVPDQGAAITIATLTPSGKKPFTLLFRALQYNVTATSAKLAVRATAFPKTMSGRV